MNVYFVDICIEGILKVGNINIKVLIRIKVFI